MRRRRIVLGIALFVAPLLVLAAACAFPDVAFAPEGEGGAEPEAGRAEDSDGDPHVEPDGFTFIDAAVRDDATAKIDASGCDATCDCDDDGYFRTDCDAGEDAAGKKGGGDCDDTDPLRHPGQGWVEEIPDPSKDGDWNCDGVVETDPKGGIACAYEWLSCTGGSGYRNSPGCGKEGDFYECAVDKQLKCVASPKGVRPKQLCK